MRQAQDPRSGGVPGGGSEQHVCVPAPLVSEVRACSFPSWFPIFKRHTARSEIIPLPKEFLDFLLADGVHASKDNRALPAISGGQRPLDSAFTPEDEESDGDSEEGPSFPEVERQIAEAIERLGGEALPKLNWSAPKDTVWLFSHGSMKCTTADEVVLMLKASVNITHDLAHAFDGCADGPAPGGGGACPAEPICLVLKRWVDVRPSMEFRCFVRRRRLVGISQRNTGDFFEFLPGMAAELAQTVEGFFDEFVANEFPAESYVFDCHVNASGRVRLVDFNPWGGATLPLLFEWDELERLAGARHNCNPDPESSSSEGPLALGQRAARCEAPADGVADDACDGRTALPVIRVVSSAQQIRPGLRVGVPFEMYDTSSTSALADLVRKWGAADEEGSASGEEEGEEVRESDGGGGAGEQGGAEAGGGGRTTSSSDGGDVEAAAAAGEARAGRDEHRASHAHSRRSSHLASGGGGGAAAAGGTAEAGGGGGEQQGQLQPAGGGGGSGGCIDMSVSPSPAAR